MTSCAAIRPLRQPPRGWTSLQGMRGFTLIEVVTAFAILAIGLAITMQIATGSLRQSRQAAEYTEAALLAQTVLDTAGVGERLDLGETRGEWEGGYEWVLLVSPYEVPLEEGSVGLSSAAPVELVELDLTISWKRGNKTREARYRTLRAMLPMAP